MTPTKSNVDADVSAPDQFRKMLDDIRSAFNRPDLVVDVDELWRVLERYRSKASDWATFAQYDPFKYRRVLVDEDENYNVMIIGWGPGTKSCIHDHSGSHCFMKILDGDLIESRFAWPDDSGLMYPSEVGQKMNLISEAQARSNEVVYINDKVGLHRVENPSNCETATSLHVYIPPLKHCKAFDERTGRTMDCKLTFDSKCGKIVREEEKTDGSQQKIWLPDCQEGVRQ